MTKKTVVDYISEEDYPVYQELVAKMTEAKANAPKAPRAARTLTLEQKIERAKKAQAAAEAKLAALLAASEG